jgi:hypothetical protein
MLLKNKKALEKILSLQDFLIVVFFYYQNLVPTELPILRFLRN